MAAAQAHGVQQSQAANAAATLIISDEYIFNDVPTTDGKLMLRQASQLLAKNVRNGFDCKAACITQDSPGAANHAGGVGNAQVQSEHANRERCGKDVLMSCVDPTSQLPTLLTTAPFVLGSTVWTYLNGPNVVYTNHYYCVARSPKAAPLRASTLRFVSFIDDHNRPEPSGAVDFVSADTIHARLGHCGPDRAAQAIASSTGIPPCNQYKKHLSEHCEACRLGGARKHPFHGRRAEHKFTYFGERIQSDICGKFPASVTRGYEYILSFVDSYSG